MIAMETFLSKVCEIEAEHPTYRSGGDGSDAGSAGGGTCDCIGLIIGAIRRAGGKWTGTHGSNYAARNEVRALRRVTGAGSLQVGDAVFKKHEPGESGWALPAAYKNHPDQRDYYHVGVVMSVKPLSIVHCTTPGVMRDSSLGKWAYAARLTKVDDGAGDVLGGAGSGAVKGEVNGMKTLYQAVVVTANDPLNVRSAPGTSAAKLGSVPKGAIVDVLAEGEWPKIRYNELVGYASGAYLRRIEDEGSSPTASGAAAGQAGEVSGNETGHSPTASGAAAGQAGEPFGTGTGTAGNVIVPRELALQMYTALGDALGADEVVMKGD